MPVMAIVRRCPRCNREHSKYNACPISGSIAREEVVPLPRQTRVLGAEYDPGALPAKNRSSPFVTLARHDPAQDRNQERGSRLPDLRIRIDRRSRSVRNNKISSRTGMPSQLARAQEKLRGLPKNNERRRMITRMTTGHRPIIEDLPQLDIRELQCKGLLEEGEPRRSGPYEGDFYLESNIYQVKIFPPGRPPQIISIHQKTQWGFAGGRSMCLQFKCPTCPPPTPKRTGYCGKLRDLGDLFRCKTCAVEAGAVYHSQTLSPKNRKRHKAEKIKKRLG